jgi:hypothetical protein
MILSCSNDNSTESKISVDAKSEEVQVESMNTDTIKVDANFAIKMLDEAVVSLNNVPPEFQWRDTQLLINEAQKTLNEGQIELSIKLSQDAIQQSQLMIEQKEFAKNNWQNLIPK